MKYKIVTIKHKESDILKGRTDLEVATKMGCDISYINRLRRGEREASYEFYQKLKEVLLTD